MIIFFFVDRRGTSFKYQISKLGIYNFFKINKGELNVCSNIKPILSLNHLYHCKKHSYFTFLSPLFTIVPKTKTFFTQMSPIDYRKLAQAYTILKHNGLIITLRETTGRKREKRIQFLLEFEAWLRLTNIIVTLHGYKVNRVLHWIIVNRIITWSRSLLVSSVILKINLNSLEYELCDAKLCKTNK